MNKPELSVVLPSIRQNLLDGMYDSLLRSTKRTFELIIVSPFGLTSKLQSLGNIKLVRDLGSPIRCNQIGITLAEGKYVYATHSDDAIFFEDSLDKNLDVLESMGQEENNVVVCKYSESKDFSAKDRFQDDDYYRINNAYPVFPNYVPNDWFIFNAAIFHNSYLQKLGGWDASMFEVCPYAHADLGIRTYLDGAKVKLSEFPISMVDHGHDDHKPIEYAQILGDMPRFKEKYSKPLNTIQSRININNWKNAESIWSKRFRTQ